VLNPEFGQSKSKKSHERAAQVVKLPLRRKKIMAQSLSRILVHIIFSAKDRFAFFIGAGLRKRMHAYIARVFYAHDSPAIEVGGTKDHVHILCLLSRNHRASEIVKKAKASSSGWVKSQQERCLRFSWQSGYGAFSIHQLQIDSLGEYIKGQEEHHHRRSFQEEYLEILRQYQIPYDKRYLWT
jgi:putative transposase